VSSARNQPPASLQNQKIKEKRREETKQHTLVLHSSLHILAT